MLFASFIFFFYFLIGKSYASGCGGARKVLNTMEMYNTEQDSWKTLSPMHRNRCKFAAVYI